MTGMNLFLLQCMSCLPNMSCQIVYIRQDMSSFALLHSRRYKCMLSH